jgi:hypothetical protein
VPTKKGICADCDEGALVTSIDGGPWLCQKCKNKKNPKEDKEEKVDLSKIPKVGFRQKTTLKQALASVDRAKQWDLSVMMITDDFPTFKFVVPDMDDFGWASSVAEVFRNNFLTRKKGIFTYLVMVSGNEMTFRPPGAGQAYPGPSITMRDPADFMKNGSGKKGVLSDWICVMCHEIIHYLHWRWSIIPAPNDKYDPDYENMVSGQPNPKLVIPLYNEKEAEGLKELSNPPSPFTENAFRVKKFGLAARKSYESIGEFGKDSTKVDLEELYLCSSQFAAGR